MVKFERVLAHIEKYNGTKKYPWKTPLAYKFSYTMQIRINVPTASIWQTYRSSLTSNLTGLDVDLSMPRKVKYDGGVGLPTYDFLLKFKRNTLPNSVPLQNTSL